MSNKGQIFKGIVDTFALNKKKLAGQLDISQTYLYSLFNNSEMPDKYFYKLQEHYKINVREYYPDLPMRPEDVRDKISNNYISIEEHQELKENLMSTQKKYIRALEEVNELREEVAKYRNSTATESETKEKK
jgi:hypothetical protein